MRRFDRDDVRRQVHQQELGCLFCSGQIILLFLERYSEPFSGPFTAKAPPSVLSRRSLNSASLLLAFSNAANALLRSMMQVLEPVCHALLEALPARPFTTAVIAGYKKHHLHLNKQQFLAETDIISCLHGGKGCVCVSVCVCVCVCLCV